MKLHQRDILNVSLMLTVLFTCCQRLIRCLFDIIGRCIGHQHHHSLGHTHSPSVDG